MPRKKSTHVDDPAAVGRRLKEARERAGLSQRRLAFAGCSAAYISRIEAGERIPSLQLLRDLAGCLGVTETWLATGREFNASTLLRDAEVALRLDETDEAAKLFEKALAEAEDAAGRSRALEGLGQVALRAGEPRRAVGLFEQALEVAGEGAPDRPSLADSLARAYAVLGELAPAISVLEQCVERYESDPVQFVRFAGLLGAALTDSGHFAEAERVIGRALTRGRDIADAYTRARLYWSESRILLEQGRSAAAEEYAQKTLETLRATEDTYAIALILQTLAHINLDLGRPADALDFLREGWPIISAAATPLEITQYRIEEARALAALGEHERAAALAMELTGQLRDAHRVDAGRAYVLLGETFAAVGDAERAREVYELAIELLEQRAPNRYLVKAYQQLAALLRRHGETEQALELLVRALGIQEQAGRPLA